MFLKLTRMDDNFIYINFNTIEIFLNNQGATDIFSQNDNHPYKVKETPEQIMEMLNETIQFTNK